MGSRKHRQTSKIINRAPKGIRPRTHTVYHADAGYCIWYFCAVLSTGALYFQHAISEGRCQFEVPKGSSSFVCDHAPLCLIWPTGEVTGELVSSDGSILLNPRSDHGKPRQFSPLGSSRALERMLYVSSAELGIVSGRNRMARKRHK